MVLANGQPYSALIANSDLTVQAIQGLVFKLWRGRAQFTHEESVRARGGAKESYHSSSSSSSSSSKNRRSLLLKVLRPSRCRCACVRFCANS